MQGLRQMPAFLETVQGRTKRSDLSCVLPLAVLSPRGGFVVLSPYRACDKTSYTRDRQYIAYTLE